MQGSRFSLVRRSGVAGSAAGYYQNQVVVEEVDSIQRFADDVRQGLSSIGRNNKHIPSTWLYDAEGSRLFQEICKQPEYYLTGCEREIIEDCSPEIAQLILKQEALNIVELGCGDGEKTKILIAELLNKGAEARYVPIDISSPALEQCASAMREEFANLLINPFLGEFSRGLENLQPCGSDQTPGSGQNCRNLVLFLGSNIGNMHWHEAIAFLCKISAKIRPGDFLLIGFDLIKDPKEILEPAYNDAAGVTAEFNRNLLRRINRELGGCFRTENFEHYSKFNFQKGAIESFLYSKVTQDVYVKTLGRSFHFEQFEPIHTESSGKYTVDEICRLANISGFVIEAGFLDSRQYFVDSLWRKI